MNPSILTSEEQPDPALMIAISNCNKLISEAPDHVLVKLYVISVEQGIMYAVKDDAREFLTKRLEHLQQLTPDQIALEYRNATKAIFENGDKRSIFNWIQDTTNGIMAIVKNEADEAASKRS